MPTPLYFPERKFKCMGGAQLALGILSFIVGVVLLVLLIVYYDEMIDEPRSLELELEPEAYLTFYFGAMGVACMSGILHIVTGALGIAAAKTTKAHRQSGLKTGYITLNTINALFFTWQMTVFGLGGLFLVTYDYGLDDDDWPAERITLVVFWGIMALLGVILLLLALSAASISCCCAPVIDKEKDLLPPIPQQLPQGYPNYPQGTNRSNHSQVQPQGYPSYQQKY